MSYTISFSDKSVIRIYRERNLLLGSYSIELIRSDGSTTSELYKTNEAYKLDYDFTKSQDKLLKEITELGFSIFFLRDDRSLKNDDFEDSSRTTKIKKDKQIAGEWVYSSGRTVIEAQQISENRDKELQITLNRTSHLLRNKLITASMGGEEGVRQIYTTIIKNIYKQGASPNKDITNKKSSLIKDLINLDKRSLEFRKYGLLSRVNTDQLIGELKKAKKPHFQLIAQVVSSFIESQQAKFSALESLRSSLNKFIELLNSFFNDKKIEFDVMEGINIISKTGNKLNSSNLSSGEKQILFLLCNVLISGNTASLFLIDEPELSLNVKWQRKLINSLLEVASDSRCQFIFATHSLEILAKHKNQIVKLSNVK